MKDQMQTLSEVIAILVHRLGGKVVIEQHEFENPPVATVTRMPDGKTKIETPESKLLVRPHKSKVQS